MGRSKITVGVRMRILSLQKIGLLVPVAIVTFAVSLPAVAQRNGDLNGSGIAIHGVPPSVTSFGFGGRPGFHGVPSSVTSIGFGANPGFHGMPASVTSQGFGSSPFRTHQGNHQEPPFLLHRHHDHHFVNPFYSNVIAVPYAYPVYVTDPGTDDSVDDSAEEDDRGGPTIFDRRGPGNANYYAPERGQDEPNRSERNRSEEDYRTASPAPASQPEVAQQPRTILVFKDGRRLEVSNYAIAGFTLYDLTDGLARKVALAELDLPATVKQNDDRGVDFQLPTGTKLN